MKRHVLLVQSRSHSGPWEAKPHDILDIRPPLLAGSWERSWQKRYVDHAAIARWLIDPEAHGADGERVQVILAVDVEAQHTAFW